MIAGYTILDNRCESASCRRMQATLSAWTHCPAAVLDSARKESSPARAAQIYADYIKDYRENISWVELATRIALI